MQDLHLCEFPYKKMTGNPPSLLHLHLTSSHPSNLIEISKSETEAYFGPARLINTSSLPAIPFAA